MFLVNYVGVCCNLIGYWNNWQQKQETDSKKKKRIHLNKQF